MPYKTGLNSIPKKQGKSWGKENQYFFFLPHRNGAGLSSEKGNNFSSAKV